MLLEPACQGPRRPHIGRGRTTNCVGVEEKGTPRASHVRREVGKEDCTGEHASRKVQERRCIGLLLGEAIQSGWGGQCLGSRSLVLAKAMRMVR
jgi:hypothetical protein